MFRKTHNNMSTKAVQWNVRGTKARFAELQILLRMEQPEAVALQEIQSGNAETLNKIYNNKYNWQTKHTTPNKKGGVALAIEKTFPHTFIDLQTPLEVTAATIENPDKVTIASIYISQKNRHTSNASKLKKQLTKLTKQLPKPFILMGDFNAHNTIWGSTHTDPKGRAIEQLLIEQNLQILNNGNQTRIDEATGKTSAIDLTIISPNLYNRYKWKVHNDTKGSDHYPISIEQNTTTPHKLNSHKKWAYEKADWEKYKEHLLNTNKENEITDAGALTNAIQRAAKAHIPQTEWYTKKVKVPWWNGELTKLIKERRKTLRKLRKTPEENTQEKAKALENFKKARNKARDTIAKAKTESWSSFTASFDAKLNPADLWKKINRLRGHKAKTQKIILKQNQTVIDNPQDVAEILANHYQEISENKNTTKSITKRNQIRSSTKRTTSTKQRKIAEDYNKKFSIEELERALGATNKRGVGPDKVGYPMIRNLPEQIKHTFVAIINNIWEKGQIPQTWKTGDIVPILKSGKNPQDSNSYRPITMLSCLGKTMERMVNHRLKSIIEANNLLDDRQFGFRQGKGVDSFLAELEETLEKYHNKRNHTELISLDIAKAYDTIKREAILNTIEKWGIKNQMRNYIENFLHNREFQVNINGSKSKLKEQKNGVPQGAVLSATLFIIGFNEIFETINKDTDIIAYADDITLITSAKQQRGNKKKTQRNINKIVKWAKSIGLEINEEKSNKIHICNRRKHTQDCTILINGKPIKTVNEIQILGVTIDKKLNMHKHINKLKNQTARNLNIIKILSNNKFRAPRETLMKITQAIITPKIAHGIGFYSRAKETIIKKLEPTYNAAVRKASGALITSPIKAIMAEAGVLPFKFKIAELITSKAIKLMQRPNANNNIQVRRAKRIFKTLTDESIPQIVNSTLLPRWRPHNTKIDWEIARHYKKNEPNEKARQLHNEAIEKRYSNHHKIYTDGSKTKERVATAATDKNSSLCSELPNESSIFTAEAYAILEATNLITQNNKPIIIFSDSASVINAIQHNKSKHPYILKYLEKTKGKDITIKWIPSHVGIEGNEQADHLARNSTSNNILHEVTPQDAITWTTNTIKNTWAIEWRKSKTKLNKVKNTIDKWTDRTIPHEQVKLTRIRIGHTKLTHSKQTFKSQKTCQYCNKRTTPTIRHIITKCKAFIKERTENNITGNYQTIIGNNKEREDRILRYLRKIGMYIRI